MKKKSKLFLSLMIFVLILGGCTSIVADPVAPTSENKQTDVPTATLDPTPTNTLIPTLTPTNTPEPTETPTPTLLPNPTIVPTTQPVEWDVDPYIIKDIEGEYKGVTVKASLIIDKSLGDIVESVEVNDDIFAEVIVRSLVYVIYQRNSGDFFLSITHQEVDRLVKIWAEAQKTGSEVYWRQVQLDSISANDLNDGNGYSEKIYNFWPMYEGPTPTDVVALGKITVVYFDSTKSGIINTLNVVPGDLFGEALGSNIDGKNFIFYFGQDVKSSVRELVNITGWSLEYSTEYIFKEPLTNLSEYLIENGDRIGLGREYYCHIDVFTLLTEGGAAEYKIKIK